MRTFSIVGEQADRWTGRQTQRTRNGQVDGPMDIFNESLRKACRDSLKMSSPRRLVVIQRAWVSVHSAGNMSACARTGTALEVNASPDRMDLPPQHIAAAREAGVKFAVDTDAHSLADLTHMPYGVAAAQFGGLTPADVINAWPLGRLEEFLRKGR